MSRIVSAGGAGVLDITEYSPSSAIDVNFTRGGKTVWATFERADFIAGLRAAGVSATDFPEPTLKEKMDALPVGTKVYVQQHLGDTPTPLIRIGHAGWINVTNGNEASVEGMTQEGYALVRVVPADV